MNTIDSRQEFKYEFIAGVSLSNDLHRLNRGNSNLDTNKERQVFQNKLNIKQNQISSMALNENSDKKQLEIIGLEFGPKLSSNSNNNHLLIKNSNIPKYKLSKVDQTMLQLPKRTTFIAGRKAQENVLSRTWTSHVPFPSQLTTSDKLTITSPTRRVNTSIQSSDDVGKRM